MVISLRVTLLAVAGLALSAVVADIVHVVLVAPLFRTGDETHLALAIRDAGASPSPELSSDDLQDLINEIAASRLFPPPPPPSAIVPTGGSSPGSGPPPLPIVDFSKRLKLLGTAMRDGGVAVAIVEWVETKKHGLYRLHDRLGDVGELVEIRKDWITIQAGSLTERLQPEWDKVLKKPLPQALPLLATKTAPTGAARPGLLPGSGGVPFLDRLALTAIDPSMQGKSLQDPAVPLRENGAFRGWRLPAVPSASLYAKLGLRPDDIVRKVNGSEVPETTNLLLTLLDAAQDETLSVDLLRHNHPVRMNFNLR